MEEKKEKPEQLMQLSCEEYAARLASRAPVPGGGGAAALVAALGAALCSMVGNLTVGKKKYQMVEKEMQGLIRRVSRLQKELEEMVQVDADSFAPLAAAYHMPKNTPEEQAEREKVLEECLKKAAEPPIIIMRKICDVISMIGVFQNKGSAIAVSDAGVAAAICAAGLRGAALNVYINTKDMKDRTYADRLNQEAEDMLDIYCPLADHIYDDILNDLVEKQGGRHNSSGT